MGKDIPSIPTNYTLKLGGEGNTDIGFDLEVGGVEGGVPLDLRVGSPADLPLGIQVGSPADLPLTVEVGGADSPLDLRIGSTADLPLGLQISSPADLPLMVEAGVGGKLDGNGDLIPIGLEVGGGEKPVGLEVGGGKKPVGLEVGGGEKPVGLEVGGGKKPVAVDLCLSLAITEIPSVRVHMPAKYEFGFCLFGMPVYNFTFKGDTALVTEDNPPRIFYPSKESPSPPKGGDYTGDINNFTYTTMSNEDYTGNITDATYTAMPNTDEESTAFYQAKESAEPSEDSSEITYTVTLEDENDET